MAGVFDFLDDGFGAASLGGEVADDGRGRDPRAGRRGAAGKATSRRRRNPSPPSRRPCYSRSAFAVLLTEWSGRKNTASGVKRARRRRRGSRSQAPPGNALLARLCLASYPLGRQSLPDSAFPGTAWERGVANGRPWLHTRAASVFSLLAARRAAISSRNSAQHLAAGDGDRPAAARTGSPAPAAGPATSA